MGWSVVCTCGSSSSYSFALSRCERSVHKCTLWYPSCLLIIWMYLVISVISVDYMNVFFVIFVVAVDCMNANIVISVISVDYMNVFFVIFVVAVDCMNANIVIFVVSVDFMNVYALVVYVCNSSLVLYPSSYLIFHLGNIYYSYAEVNKQSEEM